MDRSGNHSRRLPPSLRALPGRGLALPVFRVDAHGSASELYRAPKEPSREREREDGDGEYGFGMYLYVCVAWAIGPSFRLCGPLRGCRRSRGFDEGSKTARGYCTLHMGAIVCATIRGRNIVESSRTLDGFNCPLCLIIFIFFPIT